jgi:hypothetical protein
MILLQTRQDERIATLESPPAFTTKPYEVIVWCERVFLFVDYDENHDLVYMEEFPWHAPDDSGLESAE